MTGLFFIPVQSSTRSPSTRSRGWVVHAFIAAGLASLPPYALATDAAGPPPAAAAIPVSVTEYRNRLQVLDKIVAGCQRQMIPANCDSETVGPDLQLSLQGGPRIVRFKWLRDVLLQGAKYQENKAKAEADAKKAAEKAKSAKPVEQQNAKNTSDQGDDEDDADQAPLPVMLQLQSPEFSPTTVEQRLVSARERLAQDLAAVDAIAGGKAAPSNAVPSAAIPRQKLAGILSAKEYKTTVTGPTLKDRLLEKVALWINHVIGKLADAGGKSKWIGTAAEIGFGLLLCVVLVWFLIRLEKQGRFGSGLIRPGSGSGAASARDWQLWFQDAREAAGRRDWRNAIHLIYWASISRLEGTGMWPADRARTPREYLALLSQESRHRPDLTALTRSFERTWYAGRAAAEADFQQAEKLAANLGVGQGVR